jgi:RNA-directed DNA polymerase
VLTIRGRTQSVAEFRAQGGHDGKRRRLGIAAVRDRVVQASLKLVLKPIFEADFYPCSYGFRPRTRAQDAIAETVRFANNTYEWMVEGDITACLDVSSHCFFR